MEVDLGKPCNETREQLLVARCQTFIVQRVLVGIGLSFRQPVCELRLSRQSMTASPPETINAIPLAQPGMAIPLTETSHPRTRRVIWRIATNEKTIIDITANGFISDLRSVALQRRRDLPFPESGPTAELSGRRR